MTRRDFPIDWTQVGDNVFTAFGWSVVSLGAVLAVEMVVLTVLTVVG